MATVVSKDGTRIGFTREGTGPALVLVDGAMCFRAFGPAGGLARALATDFTVYTYDRRGRGESGDSKTYAVSREVEDLAAVVEEAGGSAFVFGISSGAILALRAAAGGVKANGLGLYEPAPLEEKGPASEYSRRLAGLLAENRRGDAVELFLTAVGTPPQAIAGMRAAPFFPLMESIAPTLEYDRLILSDAAGLRAQVGRLKVPVHVLAGGASPERLRTAAADLARMIPKAHARTLDGQNHDPSPSVLGPALRDCFLAQEPRRRSS